jgi:type I restriction enzyme S subunit
MKMELAEGFKDTEIGRIPKEWKVVRLGDEGIAEIRSNRVISGFEKVAFIPMELIPDSCIFANYELRPMDEVKSFTYCERGDLLLAKITPSLENGKQGIVPDDVPNGFALATTEVFPIVPKGVDKLYLFYLLKFSKFRNKIIASMIGTTGRQRASKESVEKLKIPLPPLPEQRKIAEILSTVDKKLELEKKKKEKLKHVKKGLMSYLLTGRRRVEVVENE